MRPIRYARGMQGRYGIKATVNGRRGLSNRTFNSKRSATNYVNTLIKKHEQGKYKNIKNPRIVVAKRR